MYGAVRFSHLLSLLTPVATSRGRVFSRVASPLVRNLSETVMGQDGGMKARTAARLAWSLWAAYVLATVAFVLLARLNQGIQEHLAASLPILLAFAAFAAIGALLVSRFHRHPIGWIFVTIGLLSLIHISEPTRRTPI